MILCWTNSEHKSLQFGSDEPGNWSQDLINAIDRVFPFNPSLRGEPAADADHNHWSILISWAKERILNPSAPCAYCWLSKTPKAQWFYYLKLRLKIKSTFLSNRPPASFTAPPFFMPVCTHLTAGIVLPLEIWWDVRDKHLSCTTKPSVLLSICLQPGCRPPPHYFTSIIACFWLVSAVVSVSCRQARCWKPSQPPPSSLLFKISVSSRHLSSNPALCIFPHYHPSCGAVVIQGWTLATPFAISLETRLSLFKAFLCESDLIDLRGLKQVNGFAGFEAGIFSINWAEIFATLLLWCRSQTWAVWFNVRSMTDLLFTALGTGPRKNTCDLGADPQCWAV